MTIEYGLLVYGFNKECLKYTLTPTYAKIKIKDINKATTKAKEQSETQRIKNRKEIYKYWMGRRCKIKVKQ